MKGLTKEGPPCLEVLRHYECYCYQAAYYLLGNERDALAAAQAALTELAGGIPLGVLPEPERLLHIRRCVTHHSLHIRKLAVPAV
ncbi:hypothetical protein [Gorillibacterium sp. sgz5001074]|uniref:hypothetical protein n=1 Tax=Gorillibacterium sp. sgz5001074 TaxID=3446695 RepID=UPI003F66C7C3